jgi:hypothetical protein
LAETRFWLPAIWQHVWLSAILSDLALDPDPILEGSPCPENCRLCVDVCPYMRLANTELKQTDCSHYAFGGENGGEYRLNATNAAFFARTALVRKTAALPDLRIETQME